MFHSAALKLTLWYLAIIMSLSIGFSGIVYHFSGDELARSRQREIKYLSRQMATPGVTTRGWNDLRDQEVAQGLDRIKNNLILFNLMVLMAGGLLSYYLARRTLTPIEEAMEAQKRFTGDASHELRTPLTAMQTELEVALRDSSLSKQRAIGLLRSNLEEVEKLKALSDGLLRLASMDQQPLTELVALDMVVKDAAASWRKAAIQKDLMLSLKLSKASVRGDREALADLVSILLDNAVKYSPPGGRIKITIFSRDHRAGLSIADQGRGIASADLPRIFERFFRTDNARGERDGGGYGLGLALAKQIVEVHGGSLSVESTIGSGSTFIVSLPAA